MQVTNEGFLFSGITNNADVGVLEDFSTLGAMTDVTVGITQTGDIPKANIYLKEQGFISLTNVLESESDLDKFIRSKKGVYGIIGDITMVCIARVDTSTGEFRKLELYTPIADIDRGGNKIEIVCDRLSKTKGFHHRVISKDMYDILETTVKSNLLSYSLTGRADFIRSRL